MSGGNSTNTTSPSAPPPGGQADSKIVRQKRSNMPIIATIATVLVIAVIVVAGWSAGLWLKPAATNTTCAGKGELPAKGTLLGEGSTLVAPLMDQWASGYWGGTVVTYDSVGSSSGITAITNKVADFGASDAPLTSAQRTAAPGLLTIPESAGGVVPIFNVPGVSLDFTGSVLAQIFDGNITNWNNTPLQTLNPHVILPVQTIVPVYRTGGSGTTFIFTSFLTLEDRYWKNVYGKGLNWPTNISVGVGASGNGGVATTVSTTSWSIGYVDLNYALNSASGVGIGSVENPKGKFIRATVANTESALVDSNVTLPAAGASWYNVSLLNAPGPADYPVSSLTYVLVYQNLSVAYPSGGGNVYTLAKAENLIDFLTWAVTLGQNYSALLFYAPLPTFIESADTAAINSMTFNGASVPVCVPVTT